MKRLKKSAGALMRFPADKVRSVVVNAVVDAGLRRTQIASDGNVEKSSEH